MAISCLKQLLMKACERRASSWISMDVYHLQTRNQSKSGRTTKVVHNPGKKKKESGWKLHMISVSSVSHLKKNQVFADRFVLGQWRPAHGHCCLVFGVAGSSTRHFQDLFVMFWDGKFACWPSSFLYFGMKVLELLDSQFWIDIFRFDQLGVWHPTATPGVESVTTLRGRWIGEDSSHLRPQPC